MAGAHWARRPPTSRHDQAHDRRCRLCEVSPRTHDGLPAEDRPFASAGSHRAPDSERRYVEDGARSPEETVKTQRSGRGIFVVRDDPLQRRAVVNMCGRDPGGVADI
jgi:hypothetical protein